MSRELDPKAVAAAHWDLNAHPLGSVESRAAARALAQAREELSWDTELRYDPSLSYAKLIEGVRLKHAEAEARGERIKPDLSPIFIPPDKANTPRGKFLARINAFRARVAALYAEKEQTA